MISRENNFDLIRLIAALEVAIGHILKHLDCTSILPTWSVKFPFPGVFCFFVISGFLIASSFDRNPQFTKYIKNRLLRIVPALWVAFILLCLVLSYFGFINKENLRTPQLWGWFVGQLTLFQYYTPDSLRAFGVGCPNGSLWTIPVEFVFYLLLPMLIYCFKEKKKTGLIICGIISIACNILLTKYHNGSLITKIISCSIIPWFYCFIAGSLLYYNWDKVNRFIVGKAAYYIIAYLIFVNVFSGPAYNISSITNLIANLILALMTISLAYTIPKLGGFLKGFDISYGIYVYHMIVVNIFVQLGLMHNMYYAVMVLTISILLSILSWKFIESQFLKLK